MLSWPCCSENHEQALNVRIDAETKAQAEAVLTKLGLAPSDAIRMLYRQLIMRQGLPFVPRIETPTVKGKDMEKKRAIIKASIKKHKAVLDDLAGR